MPPTRKELALRYLRRKLEEGALTPGARLSDLALSREMGISRTPVREAIQTLVAEGIARAEPHAGVFVKALTRNDVRELYELREALEGFAASRVAARRDELDKEIDRLGALCTELRALHDQVLADGRDLLSERETLQQRKSDLGFHRLLIALANNGRITQAVRDSAMLTRIFGAMSSVMSLPMMTNACAAHEAVLEAVERGDPDAARSAMAAHVRSGMEGRLANWEDSPHGNGIQGPLRDLLHEGETAEEPRSGFC